MGTWTGRIEDVLDREENGLLTIVVVRGHVRSAIAIDARCAGVLRGDLIEVDETSSPAVVRLVARPRYSDPDGDAWRWRRPGAARSRMELLWLRDSGVRALRGYLHDEGFLEVPSPLLNPSTCPDVHIDSFVAGDGHLSTSTEYQLKRLLVGGFERIFSLTQNFRRGDIGALHSPEFTMLEWARAHATLAEIERDVERMTAQALHAIAPSTTHVRANGHEVQVVGTPWRHLSVREALTRHLSVDVDPEFSLATLRQSAERAGISADASVMSDRHALVSLLIDRVSAHLGCDVPTFLVDWPSFMTSSGEQRDAETAERSELFIAGIEIADGFPALLDPERQRKLFARELSRRRAEGKSAVALDERYLWALEEGMPPAAGMALGVDRLTMVLTGTASIREVLPFAWDER